MSINILRDYAHYYNKTFGVFGYRTAISSTDGKNFVEFYFLYIVVYVYSLIYFNGLWPIWKLDERERGVLFIDNPLTPVNVDLFFIDFYLLGTVLILNER